MLFKIKILPGVTKNNGMCLKGRGGSYRIAIWGKLTKGKFQLHSKQIRAEWYRFSQNLRGSFNFIAQQQPEVELKFIHHIFLRHEKERFWRKI